MRWRTVTGPQALAQHMLCERHHSDSKPQHIGPNICQNGTKHLNHQICSWEFQGLGKPCFLASEILFHANCSVKWSVLTWMWVFSTKDKERTVRIRLYALDTLTLQLLARIETLFWLSEYLCGLFGGLILATGQIVLLLNLWHEGI